MAFWNRHEFKYDLLGGLSAGIVTLPVALAYGVATGLGPMAGMITAVVLGLVATIAGGTDTQISSPTGAMTVVVAFMVAREVSIAGSLEEALPVMIMIFAGAGLIQVLLGLLKIGANIRYVPYPVVSGFMSGIGVIIILLQFKDVFGVYDLKTASVLDTLLHSWHYLSNLHLPTFLIASGSLLVIFGLPFVNQKLPGGLIALVLFTFISAFFDLPIAKIGAIQLEINHFSSEAFASAFEVDTILRVSLAAFSLALLGSINTLLTAVVADKMTNSLHDSNRELIGQGLGNLLAGVFGGFPGSGATACTVANIKAGGRNKISGIVSATFLLLTFLFGMQLIADVPKAVLGAILVHIGYVLIDFNTLKRVKNIDAADNLIMFTVLILTVTWNLVFAVVIGLVFAAFQFMKRMSDVVEEDTERTRADDLVAEAIERFNDRILKSLIELFGVLAEIKRDGNKSRKVVESFIRARVPEREVALYLDRYDNYINTQERNDDRTERSRKRTSMNSVKVLRICTLINHDLEPKEKFYMLLMLMEFVRNDDQASEIEWEFVRLVAEVFGLSSDTYEMALYLSNKKDVVSDQGLRFRNSEEFEEHVLIKNIKGPVFFGFSHRFLLSIRSISPHVKVVVLNMAFVPFMDHSGVRTCFEVVSYLNSRGIKVCFSGLNKKNHRLLKGGGVLPHLVPDEQVFRSIEECVIWLNQPAISAFSEVYPLPTYTRSHDGRDTGWRIYGLSQYPELCVKVYDQNGELLFESDDAAVNWNGRVDGELLPKGTYRYHIRWSQDGLTKVKEGELALR